MNYLSWAEEYYRDAEKILKTLKKYQSQLNGCSSKNLEKLNSTIASYRYIYYDVLNTAKLLEERYRESSDAA